MKICSLNLCVNWFNFYIFLSNLTTWCKIWERFGCSPIKRLRDLGKPFAPSYKRRQTRRAKIDENQRYCQDNWLIISQLAAKIFSSTTNSMIDRFTRSSPLMRLESAKAKIKSNCQDNRLITNLYFISVVIGLHSLFSIAKYLKFSFNDLTIIIKLIRRDW